MVVKLGRLRAFFCYLIIFYFFKKKILSVGADSLVGSASTYSAIALQASRVRVPARGPFPIHCPPSLSHFTSCHFYTVL